MQKIKILELWQKNLKNIKLYLVKKQNNQDYQQVLFHKHNGLKKKLMLKQMHKNS